jgi:hypothetical protein
LKEEHRLRVFKNIVLRGIFGPKREDVAGDWRILPNLYASPNTVRVIKSRKIRWAVYAARIGGMRNAYNILVQKLQGKDNVEDLGVDGKIILEWISGK